MRERERESGFLSKLALSHHNGQTLQLKVKELKASVAKETSLVQSLGMDIEELSGKANAL